MPLSRPRLDELEQELLALETARKTEKEQEKERERAHERRRQERSITSEVLSYLLYQYKSTNTDADSATGERGRASSSASETSAQHHLGAHASSRYSVYLLY